jgi:hypothetical protein
MPTHTQRRNHACTCMSSSLQVYAHEGAVMSTLYACIGAIMPTCTCTHRRNHACTCMIMPMCICTHRCNHAHAYMHIDVIMPMHMCTLRRDHAHVHKKAGSCLHVYAHIAQSCLHVYAQKGAQSCQRVYAHIVAIMPTRICTHSRDHAHAYMHT